MNSNRTTAMKQSLCRDIGRMRLFCGVKPPKVAINPIYPDAGEPSVTRAMRPQQAGAAVSSSGSFVLQIGLVRNIAQVEKSVIRAVPVDVVDAFLRPLSSDVKPCESVAAISFPINHYGSVSVRVGPSDGADWRSRRSHQPSKRARFGVVVKKFAQELRGKIGLSHDAVLSQIGQRLTGVSAHGGLRYFTAIS